MNKYLMIMAMFMVSAISTPTLLQKFSDDQKRDTDTVVGVNEENQQQARPKKTNASYISGRTAKIDANRGGQFVVEAKLNGIRKEVLVDTGATYVALNASTARRLGIRLEKADYKYEVTTANGRAQVAVATIEEIKIGRIVIENVQATVSQDNQLETVLLGMSYLNKLDKFSIKDNTLYMKQ